VKQNRPRLAASAAGCIRNPSKEYGMSSWRPWARRAAVLTPALIVAVLLGCSDLMGTEQEAAESPLAGAEPGIHPVLVVTSESADEITLDLHLKPVGVTSTIASYQGELVYGTETLALVAAEVPQGITGAWNEPEEGRIRFVGVSLSGIDGAVLTLRFATRGPIDASDFHLQLEEITGAEGFQDLSASLKQAERPLLSRAPLD
jgi:hypothetical protein